MIDSDDNDGEIEKNVELNDNSPLAISNNNSSLGMLKYDRLYYIT